MTAFDDFLEFLDSEIRFYKEEHLPLRYQILCWIARIRPRNEMMADELMHVYHSAYKAMIRLEEERAKIDKKGLMDALARLEHSQWMEWSKAIAENESLSLNRMRRWQGELWKPYDDLTEDQKRQDQEYARKVMEIVDVFTKGRIEE